MLSFLGDHVCFSHLLTVPHGVFAGKKNKQQPGEQAEKPQRAEKTAEEVAALAAFDMMTEAASALMDRQEAMPSILLYTPPNRA